MTSAKTTSKSILASKTIWFGAATTLLGVLTAVQTIPWNAISPLWGGVAVAAIGLGVMGLRAVTGQPLSIGGK